MNEKEEILSQDKTLCGAEVISRFVKTLPRKPGVYRMLDAKGRLLYVGKAASLKDRVGSYGRLSGHSVRIARMISQTTHMEFIVTQTETEALLLEASLIKKLKPLYNISLRDDKSFPFLLIARDHPYAQLKKHRGARTQKGAYFGPFASGTALTHVLKTLQKAFLVRTCTDYVFAHRTRPCLLFHIKRCSGPCTGEISLEDHEALSRDLERFLKGKRKELHAELTREMEQASQAHDFERAALYRDRRAALDLVGQKQGVQPERLCDADIFGIAMDRGQIAIEVFFLRSFQNWGNRVYFPRIPPDELDVEGDILAAFIPQFYVNMPVPPLILTSHEVVQASLLEEALSEKTGGGVRLQRPQRGEKAAFVAQAHRNALEALARKRAEQQSEQEMRGALATLLRLKAPPKRIEVYDNSHLQGTEAVGVMVVFGPDGKMPSDYRRFSFHDLEEKGDDYAMMRNMLRRRLSSAPQDQKDERWPDLLLIDGGAGQISCALEVLASLNLGEIPVLGIAKGSERNSGREFFYTADNPPFQLPSNDPLLYYLQNLRDEAHRFAITSHRTRRSKPLSKSVLDEIPGLGRMRKRELLRRFGSAQGVSQASLEELQAIPKWPAPLALRIYHFFHERGPSL